MLVSVIIPTYNRAEKLAEALTSAKRQTFSDTQIIVVDDGSTDDTREVVKQFDDIEYVYQENQKQAAARNRGLEEARGKYIATLDSDDVWEEDFLEKSVDCIEKHNLDFVFSNWTAHRDGDLVLSAWEASNGWRKLTSTQKGNWFLPTPDEIRGLFIRTCPAPSSSLLIRKDSIVSRWNSELIIADDWCFVLDMVVEGPGRAAFTMERLWTKNVHSENIYDGRNRREIAMELEVHDTRLMKKRHLGKLTLGEKMTFNRRIMRGYIVGAIFFVRDKLGLKRFSQRMRSKLEVSE